MPPYPICFYYFRRWQANGRWAELNKMLVAHERRRSAPLRQASPSVAIIDAQSIKCGARGVADKGFDGHKQIQGRKRQLAVDTGGRLLAAHVGPANENDRTGGAVLEKLHSQGFNLLQLVLTDAGYDGRPLAEWVQAHCGWRLYPAAHSLGG